MKKFESLFEQLYREPIFGILKLVLVIQVPAIVFLYAQLIVLGISAEEQIIETSFIDIILSVIFAPALETLAVMLFCWVLLGFKIPPLFIIFIQGALWATLHGYSEPARYISSFWAFSVFTAAVLYGFERSLNNKYFINFLLHFGCNAFAWIIYVFLEAVW